MSKESYIGGDYIETTGGNSTTYGESILNIAGSQFVQNGGDGVYHGTNGEAPFTEFDTGIDLYVEFEPLSSYDGEFGFDWLKVDNSDIPLKVQTDDVANMEFVYDNVKQEYASVGTFPNLKNEIKKEYTKLPLKIPYYIPWLSHMQIGQEIKLNMICKPVNSGEDITKETISFGKNEYYEVIIDGQKNETIKYIPNGTPKEITIKCIKPSKKIEIVTVDKNGKEIGKIMAVDNTKIFELPVRLVCVVKDTANKESEITQLISDFKSEKIEEYLNKKSLNQALIKTTVEIDSKYRIAFDETVWSGKFYNKTGNYFTNRKDPAGGKVSYIDDNGEEQKDREYEHILDKFLREYKTTFETDGKKFKGILLFISNINKDPADLEGGVSRTKPVNFREAIVFASNLKDKSTYAHEIAHALGLEHYFWRDPEYKNQLDELKNSIKQNERAVSSRETNIGISRNNIKINNGNIKEYEAYQKTHPNYYKENPSIDKFVKEQKANITKENNEINKLTKENEEINKLIKSLKDNLNVYKNNKFKFKEKSTFNIMDYSTKTNIYTYWQWKIMQNDIKSYYGNVIENK